MSFLWVHRQLNVLKPSYRIIWRSFGVTTFAYQSDLCRWHRQENSIRYGSTFRHQRFHSGPTLHHELIRPLPSHHSMKDNTLKYRLENKLPIMGVVTGMYQDTDHVEVLGLLGYHFLWADAEHSSASPSDIARLILAAERRGLPTLVRIGYGYQNIIGHAQKYLVAGAQGILLPQCESREDVVRIVEAVKFPPIGKRGLAGDRWNTWGIMGQDDNTSLADRVEECNRNSVVGIIVESPKGLDHLEEMLDVPEVDFVFVAPTDLSANLGLHGQIRHPKVLELVEQAGRQIQNAGKGAGTLALSSQDYQYWRDRGFTILCSVAHNFFINGAQQWIKSVADIDNSKQK